MIETPNFTECVIDVEQHTDGVDGYVVTNHVPLIERTDGTTRPIGALHDAILCQLWDHCGGLTCKELALRLSALPKTVGRRLAELRAIGAVKKSSFRKIGGCRHVIWQVVT